MTSGHARHAGKGLRFAPKGCHSSPGLKAWGFLAYLINGRFVKLFVIAMDRGGYEGSNEQMFEETQFDFRDATETRWNAHMAGVSLILEYLLDEKDKYSIQYSLTNAVKCSTKSGNMNAVRQKQVISNCSAHLEREISILKPDIIITQGDHPKQTIRRIFPVNEKEMHFGVVSLWKNEGKIILATPHPARLKGMAYRRGKMPEYFYEAIDEVKKNFGKQPTPADGWQPLLIFDVKMK